MSQPLYITENGALFANLAGGIPPTQLDITTNGLLIAYSFLLLALFLRRVLPRPSIFNTVVPTQTREYIVILPKMPLNHGSKFGSCTCGFPRKEGIPCNHMVAMSKGKSVTCMSIMLSIND